MARRGKSVRVERGIFRDDGGYRVVASFRGRQREARFPLTTRLSDLRDERDKLRAALRRGRLIFTPGRRTLDGDIRRYLPQIKHLASYKSRRSELGAWRDALGNSFDRARLEVSRVREIVADWLAAGVAPKTVKNRLLALSALYKALDGPDAQPPIHGIQIDVPRRRPRTVAPEVVVAVARNLAAQEQPKTKRHARGILRDAKTRARFMVLASMGIRPSQLKRITPADVDLARRIVLVPGAKGGEAVGHWLNADMLAAWRLFVAADAWGAFDTRSFARVLRTAGWPKGVRPYNVRHSLGQDLVERGEDYEDVADWLGHRSVSTTKRFYVPTQTGRLRALSERVDGRLGWADLVPEVVPESGAATRGNTPKNAARTRGVRTTKTGRLPAKTAR